MDMNRIKVICPRCAGRKRIKLRPDVSGPEKVLYAKNCYSRKYKLKPYIAPTDTAVHEAMELLEVKR